MAAVTHHVALDVTGHDASTTGLKLAGTLVTATAAELNKLDGVTSSVTELNKLTGLTATTTELNKLAGLTATTTELNKLAGAGATVASGTQAANIADIVITYTGNDPNITPNGAVTVADGSAPSVAELLELCEELLANQSAIIAALEAYGIAASS